MNTECMRVDLKNAGNLLAFVAVFSLANIGCTAKNSANAPNAAEEFPGDKVFLVDGVRVSIPAGTVAGVADVIIEAETPNNSEQGTVAASDAVSIQVLDAQSRSVFDPAALQKSFEVAIPYRGEIQKESLVLLVEVLPTRARLYLLPNEFAIDTEKKLVTFAIAQTHVRILLSQLVAAPQPSPSQGKLQVGAPTLSLASGTYSSAQTLAITTPTAGAEIRYTLDGSTPGPNSPLYTTPLSISSSGIVKAISRKAPEMLDSEPASAVYVITGQVASPSFSLAEGTYAGSQMINLTTTTTGASIHFTLDGSEPTAASTVYTSPLSVDTSKTIRAVAVKADWQDSEKVSANYVINGAIAAPTFSLPEGSYAGPQSLSLAGPTGATIYYTIDGSEPTSSSLVYSVPLSVTTSVTVRAVAMKSGWLPSPEASAAYTINGSLAAPTFSPSAGAYGPAQSITISGPTGATIYYTTDGSQPTNASNTYHAPLTVSSSQTIRALAVRSGWTDSEVASASYTINGALASVSYSPGPGAYGPAQLVTISGPSGAAIRYTIDGSDPTDTSSLYTAPLNVTASTTLKAYAELEGWINSEITSAAYTINGTLADPNFSPSPGEFGPAQSVSLTGPTGADLHYTTDGSLPTSASPVYTAPLEITTTTQIRVLARRTGFSDSAVVSATYTINGAVAAPSVSIAAGSYSEAQTVSLSSSTPGAAIFYTIDGSTPTSSSTSYTTPISVASSMTIKALATRSGWSASEITTAAYVITINPPDSLSASAQAEQITLTWPSVTGATGYNIYWNTTGSPTTASTKISNVSSGHVFSATTGTTYYFAVTALRESQESSPSSVVTSTPSPLPTNPGSLGATASSGRSLSLSWTAGGGGTSGYKIAWQSGATAPANCSVGTIIETATIDGALSWVITGLSPVTQYSFRVCSVNNNQPADISSGVTVSATTQALATGICDSGDLDSTCVISSSKTVTANTSLFGSGSITIAAGVSLSAAAGQSFSIDVAGDVLVNGTISGNVSYLAAAHLSIASTGTMSGNYPNITAENVTIAAGGSLNADGKGHTSSISSNGGGPGGGSYSSSGPGGGGHGGSGGRGNGSAGLGGATYGSLTQPVTYGSAGAGGSFVGGAGGGALKLNVAQTLTIDGTLSAHGSNGTAHASSPSAGGAGGSIWLIVGQIAGTGTIAANGGNGLSGTLPAGGGAGGRIALYSPVRFPGSITVNGGARGGGQATVGSNGTFYSEVPFACDSGDLSTSCVVSSSRIIGSGQTIATSGHLVLSSSGALFTPGAGHDITMTIGGDLVLQTGSSVTATIVSLSAANVTVEAGATFNASITTLNTNALTVAGTMSGNYPNISAESVTIPAGGSLNADGKGHTSSIASNGGGPGGGSHSSGGGVGGAGHGGSGGRGNGTAGLGGGTYGSLTQPVTYGSAGAGATSVVGGAGGGALKLTIAQTLTVHGTLSAHGDNGTANASAPGGGGAGGSIWLVVSQIAGSGTIAANGGNGLSGTHPSGGGGGGRIALYSPVRFPGLITVNGGARGGGQATVGLNGTFYSEVPFACDSGDLSTSCVVSSSRIIGSGQTIATSGHLVLSSPGTLFTPGTGNDITMNIGGDLILQTGSSITAAIVSLTAANVTVEAGATFNASITTLDTNTLTVAGTMSGNYPNITADSVTIAAGGSLNADGKGHTSSIASAGGGPGGGGTIGYGGAGGGHGGAGGRGKVTSSAAGSTYGSLTQPVTFGSAGAGGLHVVGGAGGGALKLNVTQTLTVHGTLSAHGANGTVGGISPGAGGAGGSLWLIVGHVAGSGTIAANGGNGVSATESTGGGGGGRIALYSPARFPGTIAVNGGARGNANSFAGSNGTFYSEVPFTCDSGDLNSTCTISSTRILGSGQAITASGDLIVANGGVISTIGSADAIDINIDGNMTIESGGSTLFLANAMTTGNLSVLVGGSFVGNVSTMLTGTLTVAGTYTGDVSSLTADTIDVTGTMSGLYPDLRAETLTVGTTGVLSADGRGFSSSYAAIGGGPGGGKGTNYGVGGGGHGGAGGAGSHHAGGSVYGVAEQPLTLGSSGAGTVSSLGGSGGGLLKLTVAGTATINGILSADGIVGGTQSASTPGGGGSGGSIWLIAGALAGNGTIRALGGNGRSASSYPTGGGGGGRIALYFQTNNFDSGGGTGSVLVTGGASGGGTSVAGSVGSIHRSTLGIGHHLMFVSSESLSGDFTLGGADADCESLSDAAGYPTSIAWKAVLSTSVVDAKDRLSLVGPLLNSRGQVVAADSTGFWNSALISSIRYTELGVDAGAATVWTGTISGGLSGPETCNDWTDASSGTLGRVGQANLTTGGWLTQTTANCSSSHRLYCVSQ